VACVNAELVVPDCDADVDIAAEESFLRDNALPRDVRSCKIFTNVLAAMAHIQQQQPEENLYSPEYTVA